MKNEEYANAYTEVLEIIKYIPKHEYDKIPRCKIELFEANANKDYKFQYNPLLTLDEQNVSKRAKAIIAILFREYWATDYQKEKIKEKAKYDLEQIEKKKYEKYNPDKLFKNTDKSVTIEEKLDKDMYLIEYKESIFKKFMNKVKRFFKIRR